MVYIKNKITEYFHNDALIFVWFYIYIIFPDTAKKLVDAKHIRD